MTVRRALVVLVIAALAGVGIAVALRATASSDSRPEGSGFPPRADPIAVETAIAPRVIRFGDTITATVAVTLDSRRILPGSVRAKPEFLPWSLVAPPVRVRHDAPRTTYIRTAYTLRCLIGSCVSPRDTAALEFNPVKVTYWRVGGQKPQTAITRWPVLVVHSQIVSDDYNSPAAVTSPWRADVTTLPAASYRVSPGLVRGGAIAAGALLALAGIVLGVLAIPRRAPKLPEPEPEPEPEPMLPPLEHALVLLEDDSRTNGAADQRRALELVAEEMEERGDRRLARVARGMAWSEDVPAVGETRGLAAQVRTAIAPAEPEEEVDDAPPA